MLASGFVLGLNIQNAIGINIECHIDLRHTSWGRRDSIEVELTQMVVVLGQFPLSFEHLD